MKKAMLTAGMLALAALFLFPVLLTLVSSFMGADELNAIYNDGAQLRLIPEWVTLDAYYALIFANGKYLLMFWRSLLIALMTCLGSAVVSLVVGYLLGRTSFRGSRALHFLYTFIMMMPFQVTLLPNYIMIRRMGLFDTYWALILPGIFAPLGVFLVSQFMRDLPKEVIEAASLETNSIFRMAAHMIVPMSLPALAAQFLLTFAEMWNMVEQPLIMLQDTRKYPLSMALNSVTNDHILVVFAGAVLFMLPVMLLCRAFEDTLVQGIGGVGIEVKK